MNRRRLPGVIAGALLVGTRSGSKRADAAGNARDATLQQCATDIASCKAMLIDLTQNLTIITETTQSQAANISPQIVTAGGGPVSVGGIRQCQTNGG